MREAYRRTTLPYSRGSHVSFLGGASSDAERQPISLLRLTCSASRQSLFPSSLSLECCRRLPFILIPHPLDLLAPTRRLLLMIKEESGCVAPTALGVTLCRVCRLEAVLRAVVTIVGVLLSHDTAAMRCITNGCSRKDKDPRLKAVPCPARVAIVPTNRSGKIKDGKTSNWKHEGSQRSGSDHSSEHLKASHPPLPELRAPLDPASTPQQQQNGGFISHPVGF